MVVPAYDVAAYLPACLDSLLAQSVADLEVVVVDDGATDDSGAIADAYAARDPRVRVVHIENRGLGAARNEGIRHASGEHLGFCDADDAMPAKALEALIGLARETAAPLVTGNVARWDGTDHANGQHLVEPFRSNPSDHPLSRAGVGTGRLLIRCNASVGPTDVRATGHGRVTWTTSLVGRGGRPATVTRPE